MNGDPKTLGVLGAGSFGTALAILLGKAGGHPVHLWARNPELAARMAEERRNPEYLDTVELPPEVVEGTRRRYIEAFERITGASFERYLAEDVIAP